MKKFLTLVMALAALAGRAQTDGLTVEDFVVPQGGTATFNIELNNAEKEYAAFQFDIVLTDGISVAVNEKGKLVYAKGARFEGEEFTLSLLSPETNVYRALGYYTETSAIPGSSGAIVCVTVEAGAGLAVGSTYECRLTAINLTEPNETKHNLSDVAFAITIGEPTDTRTVLDETSTVVPATASNVDVRVKRTIKANEWSTICLPFAMNATQVKAAFGNDVELAHFTGYDATEDGEGNITGITVNFSDVTAIEANHPYIIKVSSAVNEFTVDGVDIEPEDEPCIEYDNGLTGKKRVVYSSFTGTYVANTDVPQYGLFLMDNLFYYSAGDVKMKAYRAYFDFYDVLTDVEDELGEAKIRMSFNDASGIESIRPSDNLEGAVYDLSGRRIAVSSTPSVLPKGMYIVNGKKVIVK